MEKPDLRLVTERPPRRLVVAPLVLGALALGAAGLGTWLGADEARRTIEVTELAEAAVQLALERGSEDRQVRETLIDLRRTLGWRPLESRTRVVYASLILALSTRVEEMRLAGFHAGRAAQLSPVTVSVVRAATLVLAHTGQLDDAVALVRHMFDYDARRAVALLAQVQALVLVLPLDEAIPQRAEAWTVWAEQLSRDGRNEEADGWLERTHERWPEHLPARARLAQRAFQERDWTSLAALLPGDESLPADPAAAQLLIWRAHLRVSQQDASGARADVEAALGLWESPGIRTLAGDLFETIGDVPRARQEWNRALHRTPTGQTGARRRLLRRLARLEDTHGRAAAALRLWNAVLELDPEHAEARRRVDDLAGFRR